MPNNGRGEVGWDEGVDVGREVDLETQRHFEEFREIEICRGVMDCGKGKRDSGNSEFAGRAGLLEDGGSGGVAIVWS